MRPHHQPPLVVLSALLFCAALQGQVANSSSSRNAVTAVRFWSFPDVTRVAIETVEEFRFRSDRISNPERLFFDIFGARMRLAKKGPHSVRVGDRLLRQLRIAETLPGVTRIVFDLQSDAEFTASQLTNPNRLIVELRPAAPTPPPLPGDLLSDAGGRTGIAGQTAPVASKATPPPVRATAMPRPPLPPVPAPKQVTPPSLPKGTVNSVAAQDLTRARERATAALAIPKPARLGSSRGQLLTRVLGLKINRIVLDAGHGGHDTGTTGPGGLYEKELVLDVCKRLGALIESRIGTQVVYTRSDDTFIPLEMRTEIANDQKADLFISIHANSAPEPSSSGVETYYLNFTNSRSALEVAARENASSKKSVYELKDLLQKIALQDKMEESREFAEKVQTALYSASRKANVRTRDRGVKKAPFVVLIGASMPSILAEVGFVSNPRDEALFKKPEFRQRIAEGLYKGISEYAATLSHFQVAKRGSD